MPLPLYVVDAFASRPFEGNPAAVCPLERWLDAPTMQRIAAENNLAETAFFVRRADGDYDLRWFTPLVEVDLCGHATLASAYTILRFLDPTARGARFHTRSGLLEVEREASGLAMALPSSPPVPAPANAGVERVLGVPVVAWWHGRFAIAELASERELRALEPDFFALLRTGVGALSVTAPGDEHDFVSRFFAPGLGIPEDPVTGAAHTSLVPLWSKRLGRTALRARQVSARGGELACVDAGERVILRGTCALYSEARVHID